MNPPPEHLKKFTPLLWSSVPATCLAFIVFLLTGSVEKALVAWVVIFIGLTAVVYVVVTPKEKAVRQLPVNSPPAERYQDRVATIKSVQHDRGTVMLDGTLWTVALPPECTVGTRVKITGYDGITLQVEPEHQRIIHYITHTTILRTPIKNGKGSILLEGKYCKVTGRDCPAGTEVKITDIEKDGAFRVEPLVLQHCETITQSKPL